jgi:hypothetical protein
MGETTLIKVNKNSDSLRTTIPNSITKLFELKEGEKISWEYIPKKRTCRIIPISNEQRGKLK